MKIYLAGPEVFLPDAVAVGEAKKVLCRQYGFEGLFPLDAELDMQEDVCPQDLGYRISCGNEALIRSADIVIANLTPFRGPSADVGTVYELGLARGLGKRLAGYSNDSRSFLDRSWQMFGAAVEPQPTGNVRDRDGCKIEEFDLHDNLMIEGGIRQSHGRFVIQHGVDDIHRLRDLQAFESLLCWLEDALLLE